MGAGIGAMLTANIILCEIVLREQKTISPVRLVNWITAASATQIAHFFAVTQLSQDAPDSGVHSLILKVVRNAQSSGLEILNAAVIAEAKPFAFSYGREIDPQAPGGFTLTTEFTIDMAISNPGIYYVEAWLDGKDVARAPITLRR